MGPGKVPAQQCAVVQSGFCNTLCGKPQSCKKRRVPFWFQKKKPLVRISFSTPTRISKLSRRGYPCRQVSFHRAQIMLPLEIPVTCARFGGVFAQNPGGVPLVFFPFVTPAGGRSGLAVPLAFPGRGHRPQFLPLPEPVFSSYNKPWPFFRSKSSLPSRRPVSEAPKHMGVFPRMFMKKVLLPPTGKTVRAPQMGVSTRRGFPLCEFWSPSSGP